MRVVRIHLTKASIALLRPPLDERRLYYYDTKTRGLAVAVTRAGSKSFVVYRWVRGRPERVTLGRCSDGSTAGLSIEQARKAAAEINLAIAKGENPNDRKRELRKELTLRGLFELYESRHCEVHNRRPDKPKANYRLYLSHWSGRRLSQIKRADVQALHAKLGKEIGQVTANIAIKLLRSMFNRAIDWELWDQPNPVRGIRMFVEKSRDRFLQPDELPRFFEALNGDSDELVRDFVCLALLTGARKANLLAMQFKDISFERAEWRIPETKSGTPHTVPLVPEAIAILERRKKKIDKQPKKEKDKGYVFPGKGESGHFSEPKKGWRRILDRAEYLELRRLIAAKRCLPNIRAQDLEGIVDLKSALDDARREAKEVGIDHASARINDLRIHDLRRTLGSWQAATGASLPIIGRTLHHQSVSTTAVYARLNLDPVRESMRRATSAMLAASGPEVLAGTIPRGTEVA